MVHPLDHMASDPLRQGRKDHTAEKQPDSMQFPADNKHRGSRNTVKHAERPIHETSVYKPSLPHCRCHRLEDPAEKAERKQLRDQYLKNFREAFRSNIEMMRIFDKDGKEVTPEKVRQIQRKKGLRDD